MLGHDVSPDKFTDAQDRPKEVETTVRPPSLPPSLPSSSSTRASENLSDADAKLTLPRSLSLPFLPPFLQVQMGPARSVSCGGWHTCMVTEEGKVFTCGRG